MPSRTTARALALAAAAALLPIVAIAPSAAASEMHSAGMLRPAAVPVQPAPPKRIALGDTEVQFTWAAVSGATGYRVRLTAYGQTVLDRPWSATNVFIDGLTPEATYQFSVAAVNASGTGAYSAPVSFTTPFDFVERQFGADRFATAARVSLRAHQLDGAASVYVTDGMNFPDALAAAAAAGRAGAPVLLTRSTSLPEATGRELRRLDADHAVVVGGTGAVSNTVKAQVASLASGAATRLEGANRFATAAAVSKLWSSAPTVYVANGMDFPDALAGAAAAGARDAPVLLTRGDGVPPETAAALARLRPARIVLLGGEGVISPAVATQLAASTNVTTSVQRLWGANRYATAVAVSQASFPAAGVPVLYIASGTSFPDALAGAAAAGHRGGPVLLTSQSALPSAVLAEVRRLKPKRVMLLGGPSIINDAVIAQLLPLAP